MTSERTASSPAANDPSPFRITNPGGASSFLLIGDHAGNIIPERLDKLGLGDADLSRHIAWDIGIGTLGVMLADALDAVFISQTFSRLVIDCNRDPAAVDAIPEVSDGTPIPGNANLRPADRTARVDSIHAPYHAAIAAELDRRDAAGQETILIALHSFTPMMAGVARPWHIGILHDAGDATFAKTLLTTLSGQGDLCVGDNEPYRMDLIDYSVPRHAYPARRAYAEIEVRQDLLATDAGCAAWSERLAATLQQASTLWRR